MPDSARRTVALTLMLLLGSACAGPATESPKLPPGMPYGTVRDVPVEVVAGTGENASTGDGGPALEAGLAVPGSLTFDTDGNLFIAEPARIRKVAPDGTISTFAGDGTRQPEHEREEGRSGPRGDGGPAVEAQVQSPQHLTFGPDDALYFSEPFTGRIRRVNSVGTIETVVGSGRVGCDEVGGGIDEVVEGLEDPWSYEGQASHEIIPCWLDAFAFMPDADLIFADADSRVWRVEGDRVTHFAGVEHDADAHETGDGGPAAQGRLEFIKDLAVGADGSVYIAESFFGRIRVVTPDGRIETHADGLPGVYDIVDVSQERLLVASSRGSLLSVGTDGTWTVLVEGRLVRHGAEGDRGIYLFGPVSCCDAALDPDGDLYVSVLVEGYQTVVRVSGPFH